MGEGGWREVENAEVQREWLRAGKEARNHWEKGTMYYPAWQV